MRYHVTALTAFVLAAMLAGCNTSPTAAPDSLPLSGGGGGNPSPSPSPSTTPLVVSDSPVTSASPTSTPAPTPVPTPTRLSLDFEDQAVGAAPRDFVDVATEGQLPAWVYQGNWKIQNDDHGNHVLLHDDVRQQPAVSFMRYKGNALGQPNGQMPDVYFAQVDMRPIDSPNNYPPTGDQGVQFFFLSFDHYVEVVIKPDQMEIWECNGGEPKTTKGWSRLWNMALNTAAGQMRRVGALVDKRAGNFTAYLDGQPKGTVQSSLLTPAPSWLALRGIGNVVSFDNLLVEPR